VCSTFFLVFLIKHSTIGSLQYSFYYFSIYVYILYFLYPLSDIFSYHIPYLVGVKVHLLNEHDFTPLDGRRSVFEDPPISAFPNAPHHCDNCLHDLGCLNFLFIPRSTAMCGLDHFPTSLGEAIFHK
jgi:hypothetical protein